MALCLRTPCGFVASHVWDQRRRPQLRSQVSTRCNDIKMCARALVIHTQLTSTVWTVKYVLNLVLSTLFLPIKSSTTSNTNLKFDVVDHYKNQISDKLDRPGGMYFISLFHSSSYYFSFSCMRSQLDEDFFYSFSFMKFKTIRPIILASMYKECCQ